ARARPGDAVRVGPGAARRPCGAVARDVRLALVRASPAQQRCGDRPTPVPDEPEPVRGDLRALGRESDRDDPRGSAAGRHATWDRPVPGAVFAVRPTPRPTISSAPLCLADPLQGDGVRGGPAPDSF